MELGFATTIRWTRLYKVQLNASVCGFFYNKRFSIICFHCQIVRSDEFPDSKFYTLEAGSYLISKDIRETTKFRENLQFSASCILSWLPGFKCSCFFNGLTPFQICCTWPLMFPHLALKKRRYGTHEILVLECLVLLVYPELTHRAALLLAMPLAPSSSLFVSSPGSCACLCPTFACRSIIHPVSPASILDQAHSQVKTLTAVKGSQAIYAGFIQTAITLPSSVLLALRTKKLNLRQKSWTYSLFSICFS